MSYAIGVILGAACAAVGYRLGRHQATREHIYRQQRIATLLAGEASAKRVNPLDGGVDMADPQNWGAA